MVFKTLIFVAVLGLLNVGSFINSKSMKYTKSRTKTILIVGNIVMIIAFAIFLIFGGQDFDFLKSDLDKVMEENGY